MKLYPPSNRNSKFIFRVMRLTIILLFASITISLGEVKAQKVTLNKEKISLKSALIDISKQAGYIVTFIEAETDLSVLVSIDINNVTVKEALSTLLLRQPLDFQVKGKSIAISKKKKTAPRGLVQLVPQQERVITGRIVDEEGNPISSVTVRIKGSTKVVSSDGNGAFEIGVDGEESTLVFSSIGFQNKEVPLTEASTYEIVLEQLNAELNEVVVTALGIKREEKALGYAVQKVKGDDLVTAKGVDVATSLTGKVSGMNVKNSTEFNQAPTLQIRGQSPLLVIDGVATHYVSLRDIPADDIEDITVLKGATASALYGSRGGAGVIMITTRKGVGTGLKVQVNSSTMFNSGYLAIPEVQSSYSTGQGGIYQAGSYVWGDKLDIGRTAMMYNPETHEHEETLLVSKGKNNLRNFQRSSFITNNNVSISQRGENGGIRASLTHVYNQSQYENNQLNKLTYSVTGDMSAGLFDFEGGLTYNKRFYPNMGGTGYGGGGIIYNINVWSGTEYDIRDYKDYWVIQDEQQNWMDKSWYDNPYFIVNEIIHQNDYNVVNGYFNTTFKTSDWLKLQARVGADMFSQLDKWRNPISAVGGWDKLGYFGVNRQGGYSVNTDFMATAEKQWGEFHLEGFAGMGLNYRNEDKQLSETRGGLSVPGFYSLKASVSPAVTESSLKARQDNSIYGRVSFSWRNAVFLEATGRNDWSSTLDKDNRSYFYPSFASSVVLSDLMDLPSAVSFWKLRGSWTQTKYAPDIFEINQNYSISSDVWQGLGTASYPTTIRSASLKPITKDSWEIGTGISFLKNRLTADFTYYNSLTYNQQRKASISSASGFKETLININEDLRRKGVELMLSADLIANKEFKWQTRVNWARDRYVYDKVDEEYSTDKPWVKKGARWDWQSVNDWERDAQGNLIHYGGMPRVSNYDSVIGYLDADFIWGWSNSFSYKNWALNLSFDGRVGGIAHSVTDQAMWNSGSHPDSDNEYRYDMVVNGARDYVGDGVKIVSGSVDYDSYGNIIRDDRVFEKNDQQVSYETYAVGMAPYIGSKMSQFMFSQTFIKLRDLSLTYKLPKHISGKIGAQAADVSLIGQNLWMWAKDFKYSDPDVGTDNLNSPSVRYMGVNLKIMF